MQQLGALSLTSWSLTHCTLGEAANIGRALGIEGLDLGLLHGPALAKGRLLADPEALAGEIRRLGIICPNLYWLFGNGLVDRNLADPEARAANEADFRRVLAFATAASIPTIFVLPGVCGRGIGREAALERSAASLRPLAAMAGDAGVTLTVEPHVGGFLESPGLTLALLDAVPGLKLTLDYAHFACLGFTQGEIDPLALMRRTSISARRGRVRCNASSSTARSTSRPCWRHLPATATGAGSPSNMSTRATWTRSTTTS